jgi:hypothetical protein
MTYALGREMKMTDTPYMDELVLDFQADGMTLQGLLTAIVTSDPFRMRRGEAE